MSGPLPTGTVRWGIVGCGDVTEVKSGPGLQRAEKSELVAVMRRDAAKAKDYAERHNVPNFYTTVEDLLQDANVDAIYVATPPGSHLEIARKVAAARKPCYMEKPMARNVAESTEMRAIFAEAGAPLFVAYYRRAYPRYVRLKEILDSGSLGELSSVRYVLRKRPPAGGGAGWRHDVANSGGGLFVDVGSHLLDILDFLLGPLRQVSGVAGRSAEAPQGSPEDTVAASFLAGRGVVGSATWDFRADRDEEMMEIVGSRGRVLVPDPMNGVQLIVERADGSPTETLEVHPPMPSVQEPLIQTVTNALVAGDIGLCPSTADSAVRVAEYLDAILGSFYNGRTDAFWERPETWGAAP